MDNLSGLCRHTFARRRTARNTGPLPRAAVLSAFLGTAALCASAHAGTPSACQTPGNWIDARTAFTAQGLDRGDLFRAAVAKPSIVLLGEIHTDADHHRWQLQTLAALHGLGGELVIGFEAFPRRLQPVLDDWVAGKLTEDAFLKASQWRQVWGYDAALYMPLFEFARLNRVPMIGLNVERKLVSKVAQQGWANVPAAEREGLSDPAPAVPDYQRQLARVYFLKKSPPPGANHPSGVTPGISAGTTFHEPSEDELTEVIKQPEFQRFVQAQLTWDRAMAEALAGARSRFPNATVVGILGNGHVGNGFGVPHQLKALGITDLKTFVAVSADTDMQDSSGQEAASACALAVGGYADAIFTLPHEDDAPPPGPPRLGVVLIDGDGAPRISRVVSGSVAEQAGLKTGDHVVRAAGLAVRTPDDLVEAIGRQAPGTWLPMSIRRDGQEIDVIAKFPPQAKQGP